ncbi:hypothetical protein [Parafilimonas sp.]|uniref:hypothetical protein n=1 Tax=Parafilimonas sp. TaxID=1969739 RepID=UPI0039E53B70
MNDHVLRSYSVFSKDGIVPQKFKLTGLRYGMPVLAADDDIVEDDPSAAADHIIDRVHKRNIPFHWFRSILKTPLWYKQVVQQLEQKDSSIKVLNPSSFFLLYKQYLLQNKTVR